jgi:hypothetical protein
MPTQNELEAQNARLRKDVAIGKFAVLLAAKGMKSEDAEEYAQMLEARIKVSGSQIVALDKDGQVAQGGLDSLADEAIALAKNESGGPGEEVEVPRTMGYGANKRTAQARNAGTPALPNAAALARAERENAQFRANTLTNL